MKTNLFIGTFLVYFLTCFSGFAQQGYSSASISRQKAKATHIPPSEEIKIEEYINYHRHDLILSDKKSVTMSLHWSAQQLSAKQSVILQVGFITPPFAKTKNLPPLNMTLVIDNSGSMEGDKLKKTKEGILLFVKQLRKQDFLSVVIFDHDAEVVIPSQKLQNISNLTELINGIEAEGSTNLAGGLVLGYQENLKNYDPNISNQIMILTDGDANVGEIRPDVLQLTPEKYNRAKNINLSAIAVGLNYNNSLLRTLIENADGQIHFIDNEEDITKVFQNEVGGLISPIAKDVSLDIEFDGTLQVTDFYGYEPKIYDNKVSLELENMHHDLTQVLVGLAPKYRSKKQKFPIKIRFRYYDIQTKKWMEDTQETTLCFSTEKPPKSLTEYKKQNVKEAEINAKYTFGDKSVLKNFMIADMAQALVDMADFQKNKDYKHALQVVDITLKNVQKTGFSTDKDLKRVADILENYQTILKDYLKSIK